MKKLMLSILVLGMALLALLQIASRQADASNLLPSKLDRAFVSFESPQSSVAVLPASAITTTPYHEMHFELRPGYMGTVYYSPVFTYPNDVVDGSCPFDDRAQCFAYALAVGAIDSYEEQVTEWGFDEPPDGDTPPHYDICVYTPDAAPGPFQCNLSRPASGAGASPYENFALTWIPVDVVGAWSNIDSYSSYNAFLKSLTAHEFFHNIQKGYGLSLRMTRNRWWWFTDGQTSFIPSAQYESEEFASNLRSYPGKANHYIIARLNTSLTDVRHNYALYWRFLYENYAYKQMYITEDALIEAGNLAWWQMDPIVDGTTAMDAALTETFGPETDLFAKSINDFAAANYALRFTPALPINNSFSYYDPNTTTLFCHSEERSDEESRSMKANCRPKTRFFAPYGRSE